MDQRALKGKDLSGFKEIFDATNVLVRIARSMMAQINQKGALSAQTPYHQRAAGILFAEAYSRFLAVRILCEDRFGHVSMLVLRSLLNLFVIFYWILLKRKEARAKRYIGWYWKVYRDFIQQDPSKYDRSFRKVVRAQYRAIRHLYSYKIKDKTGKVKWKVAKSWYSPWNIETMAKDAGLTNQYEDGYRILSLVEHVDPTYVLQNAADGKIKFDPRLDQGIITESLVMNFTYFRQICAEIDEIFSLGNRRLLRDLAKQQKTFKRG